VIAHYGRRLISTIALLLFSCALCAGWCQSVDWSLVSQTSSRWCRPQLSLSLTMLTRSSAIAKGLLGSVDIWSAAAQLYENLHLLRPVIGEW